MKEKIKIVLWIMFYGLVYGWKYWRTRKIRCNMDVLNSEETVNYIVGTKCSVSRFGDGELQMMSHYEQNGNPENFNVDSFQQYDSRLGERLVEVFSSTSGNHLIGLPYPFKNARGYNIYTRLFWYREWLARYAMLDKLSLSRRFGDTNFSRFYMNRSDIDCRNYIPMLKNIWRDRDILIVEGATTRLGVNNDLFDNSKSIERIIAPPRDAWARYREIMDAVVELQPAGKLILIALGHTATVLAYDLSLKGFQAIDIGHVDIEYEWWLMKAKGKVPVPHKYVNEVAEGRIMDEYEDKDYQSSIIKVIR
jgi:glycosyltransferase family protein